MQEDNLVIENQRQGQRQEQKKPQDPHQNEISNLKRLDEADQKHISEFASQVIMGLQNCHESWNLIYEDLYQKFINEKHQKEQAQGQLLKLQPNQGRKQELKLVLWILQQYQEKIKCMHQELQKRPIFYKYNSYGHIEAQRNYSLTHLSDHPFAEQQSIFAEEKEPKQGLDVSKTNEMSNLKQMSSAFLDEWFQQKNRISEGNHSQRSSMKKLEPLQKDSLLQAQQHDFLSESQHQNLKKDKQVEQKMVQIKNRQSKPSLMSSKHSLYEVKYKINTQKLTFLQFGEDNFSSLKRTHIPQLRKYDFTNITSLDLYKLNINNQIFECFVKLSFPHLQCLSLSHNLISDISPIKQLNCRNLKVLEVYWNPLNLKSAMFLSEQNFSNLIFFAISFRQCVTEKCWNVLLKQNLKNYPKLERLQIFDSDLVSKRHKTQINKWAQNRNEANRYFNIEIRWYERRSYFFSLPENKRQEIIAKWQKEVKYTYKLLPYGLEKANTYRLPSNEHQKIQEESRLRQEEKQQADLEKSRKLLKMDQTSKNMTKL